MKKQYERMKREVFLMDEQDVITSSVYVEWGADWEENKSQNEGWLGNIFG